MKTKKFIVALLLASNFWLLTSAFAQQVPIFRTHFSAGVGTTIIPSCTTQASTPTNPCIANQSQTAGTVSFNWNLVSPTSLGYFFIEGSNDLATWFILAQNQQGGSGTFSTVIATGDGVTADFSGTLTHPVTPGTVTVPFGGGSDNGVTPVGTITGAGFSSGSIVYSSGFIALHYLTPPLTGVPITVNYSVVASTGGTPGGIIYYNGAYAHIRIYIVVPTGGASTLTGDYSSLPQPVPLNITADVNINSAAVNNPVQAGSLSTANVNVVQGVQCYNPNGSTAFLQFFKVPSGTPTLGSSFFYEIPIPTHTIFNYPGPTIQIWNMSPNPSVLGAFWLGAATASAGSTPMGTPLECNVQLNTTGPFYPLTPVGP